VRGGGAAGPGRELAAAVVLAVMRSGAEEPFYRRSEAWRRGRGGGRWPASSAEL